MQFVKRIRFKLFIPLSLGTTVLFALFLPSQKLLIVHICVYIATLINQLLLLYVVDQMLPSKGASRHHKVDKTRVMLALVLKLVLLFLALSIGVQMVGNKIILPLLNYVIQIFLLGVSLKR
jgi:hypothetical protein